MGQHINWLSENGIQAVCPSLLYQGSKYDDFHLVDSPSNRKLVYRFMRGVITFHLKYVEIMTKRDALRYSRPPGGRPSLSKYDPIPTCPS